MRLDDQLAADQLQTFLHAGEAESRAPARRIDIEANAVVANGQVEGVPGSAKAHIEMMDPAVSHRVVQGFLKDAEETERYIRWHTGRNVLVAERNLDVFLPRELAAEPPH